jgi:hypothetical protein
MKNNELFSLDSGFVAEVAAMRRVLGGHALSGYQMLFTITNLIGTTHVFQCFAQQRPVVGIVVADKGLMPRQLPSTCPCQNNGLRFIFAPCTITASFCYYRNIPVAEPAAFLLWNHEFAARSSTAPSANRENAMQAERLLIILPLSGLPGMLGQGVCVIAGLRKTPQHSHSHRPAFPR